MSEEQGNFKVTDRRLFNPDGTPRDVPPEERPEVKPEPVKAETAAEPTEPVPPAPTASTEPLPVENAAPPPASEAADELPGADDPASFASFLMSIASNAASSLGMMEHPVTGKREVDLELGKHWIDVLGMLQQKTKGNLMPQEQQILEGLLADLRMQYVSFTSSTAKAPRSYTARDITGG